MELELQDAVGAWLTPSMLLLTAASGRMALLSLEVAAGSVRRLKLQPSREGPPPSCACRLGQSWVFLGSYAADSLLLHASPEGHAVSLPSWPPSRGPVSLADTIMRLECCLQKPLRLEGGTKVLALPGPEDVEEVKREAVGEGAAAESNGKVRTPTNLLIAHPAGHELA